MNLTYEQAIQIIHDDSAGLMNHVMASAALATPPHSTRATYHDLLACMARGGVCLEAARIEMCRRTGHDYAKQFDFIISTDYAYWHKYLTTHGLLDP